MKNVAFVTYNTVGGDLSSGWYSGPEGRRALVLQNTKGDGSPSSRAIGEGNRREQIGLLWIELQKSLPELDHVVVYVGANGSESAIKLAAQLPASKVTFVSCDCGLPFKEVLIQQAGLTEATRVLCECGGHRTMEKLYLGFMGTGALRPPRK